MLGKISKRLFFLDESKFSLHMSTNYGYSLVSQNTVLCQPASRGTNILLCSLISVYDVEHFKLIDEGFNRESFGDFLVECNQKKFLHPTQC